MLLFVGLGNPGTRYARNRHNIGFMAVEEIAKRHDFPEWRKSFQGTATGHSIGGEQVLLLRPDTYMNESGRAVAQVANFRRLGVADIVVFHDEIELAPAKLRVKSGGSDAGHNGLRSISAYLGNNDYRRVRIGVGRPVLKQDVETHVLSNFAKPELAWVEAMLEAIAEHAALLVRGEDSSFMNKVKLAMDKLDLGPPSVKEN